MTISYRVLSLARLFSLVYSGNTSRMGRLNTVDFLIKVACFVKE